MNNSVVWHKTYEKHNRFFISESFSMAMENQRHQQDVSSQVNDLSTEKLKECVRSEHAYTL